MLIRGARIHSFRSLENVDVPIGPVTVVIGRNGSGKTSVLEALGHLPSLEGETARPNDAPASMCWYLGYADPRDAATHLRDLLGDQAGNGEFVELVSPYMLVRYSGGIDRTAANDAEIPSGTEPTGATGPVWAFDRFRAYVDRTEAERGELVAAIGSLAASVPRGSVAQALSRLQTIADDRHGSAFVDLPELPTPSDRPLDPPSVISMFSAPTDVSPLLMRWTKAIAAAYFRGVDDEIDQAVSRLEGGEFAPLDRIGLLRPVLATWTNLTNEIAPTFLSRRGRIELAAVDGPDNDAGRLFGAVRHALRSDAGATDEALRILAEHAAGVDMHLEALYLEARAESQPSFRYSRLGTGHRRWISATIDEAARLLIETAPKETTATAIDLTRRSGRLGEPGVDPSRAPRLRLIDEPVDSIESRIHGEVVSWLRSRVRDREHLVMSTHQPSVLQAGADRSGVVVVGLTKPDRTTSAVLFGPRLLEEFQRQLDDLGIAASELMFLARGLLLVEGKDDERVIATLFDDELAARGFFVHGVGGSTSSNIIAAFRHSAYEMLDIPTWVMLDRTRDDRMPAGLRFSPAESLDTEVAAAQKVVPRLRPVPFEAPDIAFGIRPEVYSEALGCEPPLEGNEYQRWLTITRSTEAKSLVCEYGARLDGGDRAGFSRHVLPTVLRFVRNERLGASAASPWLASSMERLFDEFDRHWGPDAEHQELC